MNFSKGAACIRRLRHCATSHRWVSKWGGCVESRVCKRLLHWQCRGMGARSPLSHLLQAVSYDTFGLMTVIRQHCLCDCSPAGALSRTLHACKEGQQRLCLHRTDLMPHAPGMCVPLEPVCPSQSAADTITDYCNIAMHAVVCNEHIVPSAAVGNACGCKPPWNHYMWPGQYTILRSVLTSKS